MASNMGEQVHDGVLLSVFRAREYPSDSSCDLGSKCILRLMWRGLGGLVAQSLEQSSPWMSASEIETPTCLQ